jgi:hypothetical protein
MDWELLADGLARFGVSPRPVFELAHGYSSLLGSIAGIMIGLLIRISSARSPGLYLTRLNGVERRVRGVLVPVVG